MFENEGGEETPKLSLLLLILLLLKLNLRAFIFFAHFSADLAFALIKAIIVSFCTMMVVIELFIFDLNNYFFRRCAQKQKCGPAGGENGSPTVQTKSDRQRQSRSARSLRN